MDNAFFLAAEVIARRLPLIAGEVALLPGALLKPGHPESTRMVSEKFAALGEGFFQAGLRVVQLHLDMGILALRGDAAGLVQLSGCAPRQLARAFIAPGRRCVAENVRRLRHCPR